MLLDLFALWQTEQATTSRAALVKQALVDLVAAALPDVDVTYDEPATGLAREAVVVGSIRARHRVPALGRPRLVRDEALTAPLTFIVRWPRGTAAAAETRAFELFRAIELVLADDPTLASVGGAGIDGVLHAALRDVASDAGLTDEGPAAIVRADVEVLTRFT